MVAAIVLNPNTIYQSRYLQTALLAKLDGDGTNNEGLRILLILLTTYKGYLLVSKKKRTLLCALVHVMSLPLCMCHACAHAVSKSMLRW